MSIEAMKQALEALEETESALARCMGPHKAEEGDRHRALAKSRTTITTRRLAIEQADKKEPTKLWLWKNFVGGRPEYWAFDNPFPCVSVGGDPLTLGEPCGWALLKSSINGRPDRSEQEVINTVTRLAAPPQRQPLTEAQRQQRDGINSPNRGSLGGAHD